MDDNKKTSNSRRLTVTLLGVLGSVPGGSSELMGLGSNTSCIQLSGTDLIYFDAGTGILRTKRYDATKAHVFLTHYHYDHIIGLPFWEMMYQDVFELHIYGPVLAGIGPEQMLNELLREPFLPIKPSDFRARIVYHEIDGGTCVELNDVFVMAYAACHPGGGLIYQLVGKEEGPKVAYLADTDVSKMEIETLQSFHGADFVYGDAHFDGETYSMYSKWGHSAIEHLLDFQLQLDIKLMVLGHHAYTQEMRGLLKKVERLRKDLAFKDTQSTVVAKEGYQIEYRW